MSLLLIAIAIVGFSGVPGLCFSRRSSLGQYISVLLASAGSLVGLFFIARWLLTGGPSQPIVLDWSLFPAPNMPVKFHVDIDGLSALFLVPIFLVSMLGSIYGLGYWPQSEHPGNGRKLCFFYGQLPAGMALLVVARNALVFLFGWELMAMAAFFLVTTDDEDAEARAAGWIYLVATHISTLLLFALFALFWVQTNSFEFVALPPTANKGLVTAMFLIALVAFGIKAGVMPLHVWLPGAHAAAPSHVSALMSGVIIKMGIYGLVRTVSLLPVPPIWWGVLLLILGGISGVLGIAFAIGQQDFKRLLAYSSIENIGIISIGLGLALVGRALGHPTWIALGLGGALLHVWNHSLFKSMLFFTAGSVIHAVHTRQMDLLGGLAKKMPRTAFCCLIGAASVCALPPLNGFVSELLIYLGLFGSLGIDKGGSFVAASIAAPALALIGALAVACFVKAFAIVFLGNGRSQHAAHAHESGPMMIGPMLVLAVCCFAIGLFPQAVAPVLDRAVSVWIVPGGKPAQSLLELAPLGMVSRLGWLLVGMGLLVGGWLVRCLRTRLVESTGTWGCGYAAPTARMQYTGSSLAEILVNLFAWALRPKVKIAPVEGLFPQPASYASEIHDVVLDNAMLPASRRFADWLYWFRWAQQGSIQAYLFYILVILVLLLFWQLF